MIKRNVLYAVIGGLAVAGAILGYLYYQEQQSTASVEINVDDSGITVETD